MSSPIDLDLDFQDFTPTNSQGVENTSDASARSAQEPVGVQLRIPDNVGQTQKGPKGTTSNQGSLFQNLLHGATNTIPSSLSEETIRQLMRAPGRQQRQPSTGGYSWGLNYFAQYFDVETNEVLERIVWSAIPLRKAGIDLDQMEDSDLMAPLAGGVDDTFEETDQVKSFASARSRPYSYIERFIQSRPDFYGPFWVSATLVFAIAIFSNIISFLDYKSKIELKSDAWHYSIDELNIMSSVVMVYVTLLPTFLWFLFWFRGCSKYYTLTETICAYGYSLSIFVPLSALLTIQTTLFRYCALALASALPALVLTLSFLPIVGSDPNPAGAHLILVLVPLSHFGLAYVIHRTMLL